MSEMSVYSTACSSCQAQNSKYRCPCCKTTSCSLSCVKEHKIRLSCDGKRNKTEYVPVEKFDDLQLLSDYRLLEEIQTRVGGAASFRQHACQKWRHPTGRMQSRRNKRARWQWKNRHRRPGKSEAEHSVKQQETVNENDETGKTTTKLLSNDLNTQILNGPISTTVQHPNDDDKHVHTTV